MTDDLSHVAQARLASGLTLDDASRITGVSATEYELLESRPFDLTVGELRALCREFNKDGETIMRKWLDGFFSI